MRHFISLIAFGALAVSAWASSDSYPIRGTFLNFYRDLKPAEWEVEFQAMQDVGIETVVVSSVGRLRPDPGNPSRFNLSPEGLLFPSMLVSSRERPAHDRLEMILSLADRHGMRIYLGSLQTAADWTGGTEFSALSLYNRLLASEILQRYGRHASLQGWYFTQEIWLNWVSYYGEDYYGTKLLATWVADMIALDAAKATAATMVFKKAAQGAMPGLIPPDVQKWTSHLSAQTRIDILMPQDGIGAQAGAPSMEELAAYYRAMAAGVLASSAKTAIWSIVEEFNPLPGVDGSKYPPASAVRIKKQVDTVRPYVAGYVGWIFGDDMSPQATYYPAEAKELNRQYRLLFDGTGLISSSR